MAAKKTPMNDEQRSELITKLNDDLEEYVAGLKPKPYTEGWKEGTWEKEMQEHPLFMTEQPENGELPPLVEALSQLKYDPNVNSPDELAQNYKEDGNRNFKVKKYRWAVDAYTEGLKQKPTNVELKCQLLSNRAAANYYLGNLRSSLMDCMAAKKLKPDHLKALVKGAECCWKMKKYEECIQWCIEVLKIDASNEKIQKLKEDAAAEDKKIKRDLRKKAIEEKKKLQLEENLLAVIKKRAYKFMDPNTGKMCGLTMSALEPDHPAARGSMVHLDAEGELVWPVFLLYPEFGEMDFIQEFHESSSLQDHLNVMFGESHAPWDSNKKYIPKDLNVYFEDKDSQMLYPVDKSVPLRQLLKHKYYRILSGNPSFLVTSRGSDFDESFRKKHTVAVD